MPIRNSLWRVGAQPSPLNEAALPNEALLEAMIVARPEILSDQWMIVGRQEETGHGGRIDLLAIAPDGGLILIELKRGRTPREVVAQALDYACWAEGLGIEDVGRMFAKLTNGGDLGAAFQARFGQALDESSVNSSHQIVIVAASLDAGSERIVGYLNRRDIPINVLCFQVFDAGDHQLLSRAWLLDPVETQVSATAARTSAPREAWNGEYYVSYGHSEERSWEEAQRYSFICAGGGTWYSGTLRLLSPGDRIWVKAPGYGFVGVGRVIGPPTRATEFRLSEGNGELRPALEVLRLGNYHRQFADDPDRSEYFVPVEWAQTVSLAAAIHETGMFGNQNTVCAPKTIAWRHTVDRLKELFPNHDSLPHER